MSTDSLPTFWASVESILGKVYCCKAGHGTAEDADACFRRPWVATHPCDCAELEAKHAYQFDRGEGYHRSGCSSLRDLVRAPIGNGGGS